MTFLMFLVPPLLMAPGYANAQQPSETEIKEMIQEQFERMYQKGGVDDLENRIVVTGGGVKPFAVVTDTGDKTKTIRIKQIEEMPADVALEVLRRSLVALVKKGKIGATAVFYTTANPNKESEADRVLVVEMEHIFGPTLAQLVPFTIDEGKALLASRLLWRWRTRSSTSMWMRSRLNSVFVSDNPSIDYVKVVTEHSVTSAVLCSRADTKVHQTVCMRWK